MDVAKPVLTHSDHTTRAIHLRSYLRQIVASDRDRSNVHEHEETC